MKQALFQNGIRGGVLQKVCENCKQNFKTVRYLNLRFCSRKCANQAHSVIQSLRMKEKIASINPIKRAEIKEKISNSVSKLWETPTYRDKTILKLRENAKKRIGIKRPLYIGLKISKIRKKLISEGKLNPLKNNHIRPNYPELKFIRIIRRHNLPYKYTGDGSFWIENINPDFVQTNGKKICVEIWGDYWHNLTKEIEKDKQKLETLQKYGWQRIVFWEHELKKF